MYSLISLSSYTVQITNKKFSKISQRISMTFQMNTLIFAKMTKPKKNSIKELMFCQTNFGKLLKKERNKTLMSVNELWKVEQLNSHRTSLQHVRNNSCKPNLINSKSLFKSFGITIMLLKINLFQKQLKQTSLNSHSQILKNLLQLKF